MTFGDASFSRDDNKVTYYGENNASNQICRKSVNRCHSFTVFLVVASAQIVVNGHEVVNEFGSYLGGRVQSVLLGETVPIELFIGTNSDPTPSTKTLG